MWCLWRSRAKSRCSELTKRTKASPFLRPWALRQRATPPLKQSPHVDAKEYNHIDLRVGIILENFSTNVLAKFKNLLIYTAAERLIKTCIHSDILGNIEAFKEASDVLVWGLPWKSPCSDHRLTLYWLCFTAAQIAMWRKNINYSKYLNAIRTGLHLKIRDF